MLCPATSGLPAAEPPVYHLITVARDLHNTYPMVTHRAAKITKFVDRLHLSVAASSPQSPIPSSIHSVLADPHWHRAMEEEYTTLLSNSTWDLVPRPSDANVVTGKWIFKHKLKADGSLDRYKTRWVLREFTQCLMSTMIRLSTQW
jgi:hypothetical protein